MKISKQFREMQEFIPASHQNEIRRFLHMMEQEPQHFPGQEAGADLAKTSIQFSEMLNNGESVLLSYRIWYKRNPESGRLELEVLNPLNFDLNELYSQTPVRRLREEIRLLKGKLKSEKEKYETLIEELQLELKAQKKYTDPAAKDWSSELEEILRKTKTEQTSFDFKQGFHDLTEEGRFNDKLFGKIVKTLTAMANQGPFSVGYIIVGIVDNETDAKRFDNIYADEKTIQYDGFHITGVDAEIQRFYKDHDDYFSRIVNRLNSISEIETDFQKLLGRNLRLLKYHDKSLLVFRVKGSKKPIFFGEDIYIRSGPSTIKVKPRDWFEVFKNFTEER